MSSLHISISFKFSFGAQVRVFRYIVERDYDAIFFLTLDGGTGGAVAGVGGYTVCTLAAATPTTYTIVVGQAGYNAFPGCTPAATTGTYLAMQI